MAAHTDTSQTAYHHSKQGRGINPRTDWRQDMSKLGNIKTWGQSIWLDNLSRTLIREGSLQRLIEQDGISGVTSNPAIFRKALAESPY